MLIHTIENNEMIQIKFFQFVFLKNQKFEMLRDHRVPIEARAGIVCMCMYTKNRTNGYM